MAGMSHGDVAEFIRPIELPLLIALQLASCPKTGQAQRQGFELDSPAFNGEFTAASSSPT